ncbi:MAG: S-layer homology domain-containing protein [Clostridia bacterium]|nr:S-layer homology domain-containing protein [Clostridia bacterium]
MKKTFLLIFVILMSMFAICTVNASDSSISIGEISVNKTDSEILASAYAVNSNLLIDEVLVVGVMYHDDTLVATDTENIKFVAGIKKSLEFSFPIKDYDRIEIFVFNDINTLAPLSLGASTVEERKPFGFVFRVGVDTKDFEDEPAVILLDQTGKFNTYYFNKNTYIDQANYTKDSLLSYYGDVAPVLSNMVGQIIYYELNGSDKITKIYTESGIGALNNSQYSVRNEMSGTTFNASTQTIAGGIITSDIPVWSCKTVAASSQKTDYSMINSNAFIDEESYKIKAVVDTTNNQIAAAIVYDMYMIAPPSSPVMVVSEVSSSKDDEGNNVTVFHGYANGEEVSFACSDDTDICDTNYNAYNRTFINTGDVIQCFNQGGNSCIKVLLSSSEIDKITSGNASGFVYGSEEKVNVSGFAYAGKLYSYSNDIAVFGGDSKEYTINSSVPTYIYRPYSRRIISENVSLYNAETDLFYYSHNNDDYVWYYKYGDECKIALIIDTSADTETLVTGSNLSVVSGYGLSNPFNDLSASDADFEAFYMLNKLGFLSGHDDGSVTPDATMTRAEFITTLVRASGYEKAAKILAGKETGFSDVSSDHWAAPYINIATNKKMLPSSTGTFNPDEAILFDDAVEYVVSALGYRPVCDESKVKFLIQASSLGVLDGVTGTSGEALLRRQIAKMIYNSLEIPMMEQTSFGSSLEYSIPENYSTLLSLNKIARVNGFVTSIPFEPGNKTITFTLTNVSEQFKDQFSLNGYSNNLTVNYQKNVDLIKYYPVCAYADMSSDIITMIAMYPDSNCATLNLTKNQISYVNSSSVEYITSASSASVKTAKLDSAVGFYNNMSFSGITYSQFRDNLYRRCYPEVQLIDTDSDGDYDIVIGKEYFSGAVSGVTKSLYRIEFSNTFNNAKAFIQLNPYDEYCIYSIKDENGNILAFEDIKAGDILNVFTSEDNGYSYYDIIVSRNYIQGTVGGYDASEAKYIINNEAYENAVPLEIGMSGYFYKDIYGVILNYSETLIENTPGESGGNIPEDDSSEETSNQPYIPSPFSDLTSSESGFEAFYILNRLGYINGYEDGTIKPLENISRSQFVTMLVRILGYEKISQSLAGIDTSFDDVTGEHWAAGYINVASTYGIIKEKSGNFRPEDNITYGETIEYIISMLGYDPKLKNVEGDKGIAYLLEACDLGVVSENNQLYIDAATRKSVAQMLYNALTVPMMEQTSFGDSPQWGIPDNYKTILTHYAHVDKIEATVAAVSFDPTAAKKATIWPTKVVEAYEKTDYYNYYGTTAQSLKNIIVLYDETKVAPNENKGYSCVMYLDNKAKDETVLVMLPKAGRNVTFTLTKEQFAPQPSSNGTTKLSYYRNDDNDPRTFSLKLDYNFVAFENKSTADITYSFFTEFSRCDNSEYMSVDFIDNDNDGDYDIAFAITYKSMVVGEINTKIYKIAQDDEASGLQKSVVLDPESVDTAFDIFDEKGNLIKFEDIKKGNILNVYESDDGGYKYLKVVVTDNRITGTVKAYDSSEGKYSIDGKYYKNLASLEIGDTGTFYVDAYGVILKAELNTASRTFGYVFNADVDTVDFEDEPAIVILDQAGEFKTYYFAKNNSIDKVAYTKDTLLDTTGSIPTVKPVLSGLIGEIVAYEVNGLGEITEIYTENGTISSWGYICGIETLNNGKYVVKDYSSSGIIYNASANTIAGIIITEETPVWSCKQALHSSVETDYSLVYSNEFAHGEVYKMKLIVDTENYNMAAAVVYEMPTVSEPIIPVITPPVPVMYVTGVGSGITEDGDNATTLAGMVNGEGVSIMVTDNTDIYRTDKKTRYSRHSLAKGDVIQYTGDDVASDVTVIITSAELADPAAIPSSSYACQGEKKSDYLGMTEADGWLYACKVDKYRNNVITWDDSANNILRVPITVPSMLYRPSTNKVYATEDIDASIVETNEWDGTTYNDDYLVVYEYDGTVLAAIIVDITADTEF